MAASHHPHGKVLPPSKLQGNPLWNLFWPGLSIIIFLGGAFLLGSCNPKPVALAAATSTLRPTLVLSATPSPPTATLVVPTPTTLPTQVKKQTAVVELTEPRRPTQVPTDPPVPTQVPVAVNATWCIGSASPEDQVAVRDGIQSAVAFFTGLGVAKIPTATVYAGPELGVLDQEPGCANEIFSFMRAGEFSGANWSQNGGKQSKGVIVINTQFFTWVRVEQYRRPIVAHEFCHWVQENLMQHPLQGVNAGPRWLTEGVCQVFGFQAINRLDRFLQESRGGMEGQPPPGHLQDMEVVNAGGNGFWALCVFGADYLRQIAPNHEESLIEYYRSGPTEQNWREKFTEVFGLTPADFYDKFQAYQDAGFHAPAP